MTTYRFFHFGCWGKYNLSESENFIFKLQNFLNFTNDNELPNIISIAGDNYYPNKNKKTKIKLFYQEHFDFLFYNLCKLKTKAVKGVKLIFGNHDIDDIVIPEKNFQETELNKYALINCYTLFNTFNFINKVNNELCNNVEIFKDIIYENAPNTNIFFIDTTVFESENINYVCYNDYDILNYKTNNLLSNKELQKYQFDKINKILLNSNKKDNLILIGHHPIITFKSKKDNIISEYSLDFINFVYKILKKNNFDIKNFYYLCADTHFYEHSKIYINSNYDDKEILINQYIVGTGGADLDNIGLIDAPINIEINDNYSANFIRENAIEDYGYLNCFYNDKWNFEFINKVNLN